MTAPKRIIACAAAGLTAATVLAGCGSAPPVHANTRQVTVVGSGQVQGVPDTLTADVAIEVVAPDVTAGQINRSPSGSDVRRRDCLPRVAAATED